MSSKKKLPHFKSGASKRVEVPVSPGIRKAAERAGIESFEDATPITFKRSDVEIMSYAVNTALECVLDAECAGTDRDSYIVTALASLREAQSKLGDHLALSHAQSTVRL